MKKILIILSISTIYTQVITDLSFKTSQSIAMAGAVVSDPGIAESVFYNPANLSNIDNSQILYGITDFYGLNFIDYTYLSYAFSTSFGNFGVGYQKLVTNANSGSQANLSSESSLSISQGFDLLRDNNSSLQLGYTINYMMLNQGKTAGVSGNGSDGMPSTSINTLGIDVGIIGSLRNKVQFGVYLKNINAPSLGRGSSYQYLPRKMTIGITYRPFSYLNTNVSFERLLGKKDIQFRFGFEYKLTHNFTLRSGIQMKPNRIGVGFKYMPFKNVDFSYGLLLHHIMPSTNNFELGVSF